MYLNSLHLPTIRVFTNITSNTCLSFFLKLFTKLSVNIKKVSVHTLRSTELEYTYPANTVEVPVEKHRLTHHTSKWFACWKHWQNLHHKNNLLVEWGCGLSNLQSSNWLPLKLCAFRRLICEAIHNLQGIYGDYRGTLQI